MTPAVLRTAIKEMRCIKKVINYYSISFLILEWRKSNVMSAFGLSFLSFFTLKKNSVALVRERTIPTERPPPVGEVSANFCR